MEKELASAQRNMYKLSKTFADTAGLGQIATQIKDEVEAFMPVMPLVTALRNPGMRARHWAEMSKATGKDLLQASALHSALHSALYSALHGALHARANSTRAASSSRRRRAPNSRWSR